MTFVKMIVYGRHCKNYESCQSQVTLKVVFKCQFCLSRLSRVSRVSRLSRLSRLSLLLYEEVGGYTQGSLRFSDLI